MSLEAMKNVLEAEQAAKNAYQNASAEAKQLILEAEAAGKALLSRRQAEAREQERSMMEDAELQGGKRAEGTILHAENQCAVLRAHAEQKLPEAITLIVERIVTG